MMTILMSLMLVSGTVKLGQLFGYLTYWELLRGPNLEIGELLFFFKHDLIAVVL